MTELERVKKELRETKEILSDLLQEQGSNASGVIKAIEDGATPDNLRTLAIINGDSEDEKRKLAEGMLYRIYRGWVTSTSNELVRCVVDGECEDYESLQQRADEDLDSALTYTHDQYLVVYAADGSSTEAGAAELEEYGNDQPADQQIGLWAMLILKHDVWDRLERFGLNGDFDRGEWLESARAGEFDDWDETLRARARRAT